MAEEQNGLTLVEFYSITEKEFEKLSQKKSNALYFLDTGRLFKGNIEISSKNIIQQFSSLYAFPTPGDESIIYLDKSTNKTYRWDDNNTRYYCIGSDYEDIKIIDGNYF